MYRSSFVPKDSNRAPYRSGPAGGILNVGYFTIRSGVPIVHAVLSICLGGGGMSAGFPCGAPESTHLTMVAISASLSEGSLLNFWMPMVRSMNQGGISRAEILVLIARAHGRASLYVSKDIGAISPGWWQLMHERYKIGATSFVKVT